MKKMLKRVTSLVCCVALLLPCLTTGLTLFTAGAAGENKGFAFQSDGSDTYLALSEPLATVPATFEATINAAEYSSEWSLNAFTETHGGAALKYAKAGDGTGIEAGQPYMEKNMTSGGFVHPIGSYNTIFTPVSTLSDATSLALAFDLWFSKDMADVGYVVDVSSNINTDQGVLRKSCAQGSVKSGWYHMEIPLTDFTSNIDTKSFTDVMNPRNIQFFRIWNWHCSAQGNEAYTFRFANLKIVNIGNTFDASEFGDAMLLEKEASLGDKDFAIFTNYQGDDNWEDVYGIYAMPSGYPYIIYGGRKYIFNTNICTGRDCAIAVTFDDDVFTLYVDGTKVESTPSVTATKPVFSTPHTIGANANGKNLMVDTLKNMRVWNTVRTEDEIWSNMAFSSLKPTDTTLVGAWALDGNVTHILDTLPDLKGKNPVVYRGTRRDQWIDYEVPAEFGDDYQTVVWIPDPQNVTIGKAQKIWNDDTDWIADNVEKENIVHVVSAGDDTWSNDTGTWNVVKSGFSKFWDKVSWSSLTGNHDYDWNAGYRDTRNYNAALGLDAINSTKAKETFGGWFDESAQEAEGITYSTYKSGVENSYYFFDIGDVHWMLLQLEFCPRRSVLRWAASVLDQYPDYNVIVATHSELTGALKDPGSYYNTDSYKYTGEENVAGDMIESEEEMFDELIAPYSNVQLVLSGHSDNPYGQHAALTKNYTRDDGSVVYQMMLNAQYLDTDDNTNFTYYNDRSVGMLALLRFKADGSKVAANWYCPTDNKSYEPNPNGNEPATTMGDNALSKSNFVLPLAVVPTSGANAQKTRLNTYLNTMADPVPAASLLQSEGVAAFNKAYVDAQEALADDGRLLIADTTKLRKAIESSVASFKGEKIMPSTYSTLDFTSGTPVSNDGNLSATLETASQAEIVPYDGAYAAYSGIKDKEHNYLTVDLTNYVKNVGKDIYIEFTYHTAPACDEGWTSMVAGIHYGKNNDANYTYIGYSTEVKHYMGPLTIGTWATAGFSFKDISTSTYNNKVVIGGNPRDGIYVSKVTVYRLSDIEKMTVLTRTIPEAELKLSTLPEGESKSVLETALAAAKYVNDHVQANAIITAANTRLQAALDALDNPPATDKSALKFEMGKQIVGMGKYDSSITIPYMEALEAAYGVYANAKATQAQIDAAKNALINARKDMNVAANKVELIKLVEAQVSYDGAEALLDAAQKAAYDEALAKAKALIKDQTVIDQSLVDGAAETLATKQKALFGEDASKSGTYVFNESGATSGGDIGALKDLKTWGHTISYGSQADVGAGLFPLSDAGWPLYWFQIDTSKITGGVATDLEVEINYGWHNSWGGDATKRCMGVCRSELVDIGKDGTAIARLTDGETYFVIGSGSTLNYNIDHCLGVPANSKNNTTVFPVANAKDSITFFGFFHGQQCVCIHSITIRTVSSAKGELTAKLNTAKGMVDAVADQTAQAALQAAINAGEVVSANFFNDSVIAAAVELLKGALANAGADKSALKAALAEADALKTSLYTSSSVEAYRKVVAEVRAVYNDHASTQEAVDAATKKLTDAKALLALRADTVALRVAINSAPTVSEQECAKAYIDAFNNALNAAKAIITNTDASQEDADAALEALNKAIDGLRKGALQLAVDNAPDVTTGYTKSSADAFTNAVNAAKAVLAKDDATLEEVEAALSKLNSTKEALVAVDKSALKEALDNVYTDLDRYTPETKQAYENAVATARGVYENEEAVQMIVDMALQALLNAQKALKPTAIYGDVDGDGDITSTDARLTLQYYAKKIDASALNLTVADVDNDGDVTSTDARLILQRYAKKIDHFPVEEN